MDTTLVAPSDATQTQPPVDAPTSISDHAAQFDPSPSARSERETPEPDEPSGATLQQSRPDVGKPEDKGRHRAQSQKAGPADVPRINSLTKQLRAAEAELARLRGTTQQASTPAKTEPQAAPQQSAPTSTEDPVKSIDVSKDPLTEEQFFERYGQNTSWQTYQRYLSRYEAAALAHEQRQSNTQTQRTQVEQHVSDIGAERTKQFGEDVTAFIATKADFKDRYQAANVDGLMDVPIPPLLLEALVASGPEMYYHLVCNPALLADMHLLTDGKAVTDANVALMQRRLTSELGQTQAAVTGSVALPQQRISAPRPPNPVRTGPMKTGGDPPGDGHSLAEHAKHYDPKRRR